MGKKKRGARAGKGNKETKVEAARNPLEESFTIEELLAEYPIETQLSLMMNFNEAKRTQIIDPEKAAEFRQANWRAMRKKLILRDYVPLMASVLYLSEDTVRERVEKFDESIIELFDTFCNHGSFYAKRFQTSECRYYGLLKTVPVDPELLCHLQIITKRSTIEGELDWERDFAFIEGFCYYYMSVLDERMRLFFETNGADDTVYPAVDLASGVGVFPTAYAGKYCPPEFKATLQWYPTEWEKHESQCSNPFENMKESFRLMLQDGRGIRDVPFMCDSRESLVYANGIVVISGLETGHNNQTIGVALGVDPNNQEHISVLLQGRQDRAISVNHSNVLRAPGMDGFEREAQASISEEPLSDDSEGTPLFAKDKVVLRGLSKAELNGLNGSVVGLDPSCPERIGVMLEGHTKPISFKPSNLIRAEDGNGSYEQAMRLKVALKRKHVNGLLERSRVVQIDDRSTWSNVNDVKGRCALVTCTKLLTCVGYRDPHMWKDALELASSLLAPGGYFFQYDELYGGYGNANTMTSHAKAKSLHLELELCEEPLMSKNKSQAPGSKIPPKKVAVWRKG